VSETAIVVPLLEHTAAIVSAYVSNNSVEAGSLSDVIRQIHGALLRAGAPGEPTPPGAVPAVSVKKSVTADAITCLFEGKKFKALRRHLRTAHGMTPQEYRQHWGLPSDYPLVAPAYSATRSTMAKKIGLGRTKEKPRKGRTRA
jgi:predicted transcriptional regulator